MMPVGGTFCARALTADCQTYAGSPVAGDHRKNVSRLGGFTFWHPAGVGVIFIANPGSATRG